MESYLQDAKQLKVRNSIKKFVEEFNAFVQENDRAPVSKFKDEHFLAEKWREVKNGNTLSLVEKQYIEQYLVKVANIRFVVKQFVKEYLDFINKYKRKPKIVLDDEKVLFRKIIRYTKAENLNDEEIAYLEKNNIEVVYQQTGDIRRIVEKFVKDYNEFVETYGRNPRCTKDDDKENKLYMKYLRYTNDNKNFKLNEEEKKYIDKNLSKVEIRLPVRTFIKDFTEFIKKHKREPRTKPEEEKRLYARVSHFRYATNLNKYEIKYLEDNGFFIEQSLNQGVRFEVRLFGEEYESFIAKEGREPTYKSQNKEEIGLYLRMLKYKDRTDLNDCEIEFLSQKGIQCNQKAMQII